MIQDWVAELVGKYTFIEKSEMKGAYLNLHYRNNNIIKVKRVSIRATKGQLIKIIESIKHDTNYYNEKKVRDDTVKESMAKDKNKPMIVTNV